MQEFSTAARHAALAVAGSILVSACGAAPKDNDDASAEPSQPEAVADGEGDCLLLVWQNQADPNEDFDRANDQVDGGAISCATGTSPSRFEETLQALRDAANEGDKAALLEELSIPLLYIDANGDRRTLDSPEETAELFDDIFPPDMLDMLARVKLDDMTVVPEQGAYFQLGSLWLVVSRDGGRPRIVTVNRQALGEAAEAARRAAEENRGEPARIADE